MVLLLSLTEDTSVLINHFVPLFRGRLNHRKMLYKRWLLIWESGFSRPT